MILTNPLVEKSLESINDHLYNIPQIRYILEEAIVSQFKAINLGLTAYLALAKGNQKIILDLFVSQYNDANLTGMDKKEEFNLFKNKFLNDIVKKTVKPISPKEYSKIKIKLFNTEAPIWDSDSVNNQLKSTGSNLRLVIPSNLFLIENAIYQLTNQEKENKIDLAFILGEVDSVTSLPLGKLYDFKKEIVTSPFSPKDSPGFCFNDNIVIRQNMIRRNLENGASNFKVEKMRVFSHEFTHLIGRRKGYLKTHFVPNLIDDINRYTHFPRKLHDVKETFEFSVNNSVINSYKDIANLDLFPNRISIDELINQMIENKELMSPSNGVLQSIKFQSSRLWMKNW